MVAPQVALLFSVALLACRKCKGYAAPAVGMDESAEGTLAWQENHLELFDHGGGSAVLFSSATREIVSLPVQKDKGEWVLSFHEGLGVISYVAEDDEPFYEDWAQNLLSHKACKQGDTVFVVTASGERLVQGAYLSLHDQLQVGVMSLATYEVEHFNAYSFTHEVLGARLWWSLHDTCQRLDVRRMHRPATSAALYEKGAHLDEVGSLPEVAGHHSPICAVHGEGHRHQ